MPARSSSIAAARWASSGARSSNCNCSRKAVIGVRNSCAASARKWRCSARAPPSRAIRSLMAPISRCSSRGCDASGIGCRASTLRVATSPAARDSGARPRRRAKVNRMATRASSSRAGSTRLEAVSRASRSRSLTTLGRLHDAVLEHDGVEMPLLAGGLHLAQAAARPERQVDAGIGAVHLPAIARPHGRDEFELAVLVVDPGQLLRQARRAGDALGATLIGHGQCHLLEVALEDLVQLAQQQPPGAADQQGRAHQQGAHDPEAAHVDGSKWPCRVRRAGQGATTL